VVADVMRLRGGPEMVRAAILNTAAQDGRDVPISLPQDPGQAGKAQAADFIRALAGYRVTASPETGSKATRAAPVAAQCNIGNLAVLRGGWTMAYLEELRGFPGGGKDDQVDATSRAFTALLGQPSPAWPTRIPFLGR
jgi:predicted phage terminase large subunit-like protein